MSALASARICLLRGINVRTYIQSGNAVFDSPDSTADLETCIAKAFDPRHGFVPRVMVLTAAELDQAVALNPYEAEAGTTRALEQADTQHDRLALHGRYLYRHTPKGMSGSRIAPRLERLAGVSATARNWRSVLAIQALAH
ncbi:MAG: hypothetical protein ACI9WU_004877 [Myxococcota bacterium]